MVKQKVTNDVIETKEKKIINELSTIDKKFSELSKREDSRQSRKSKSGVSSQRRGSAPRLRSRSKPNPLLPDDS